MAELLHFLADYCSFFFEPERFRLVDSQTADHTGGFAVVVLLAGRSRGRKGFDDHDVDQRRSHGRQRGDEVAQSESDWNGYGSSGDDRAFRDHPLDSSLNRGTKPQRKSRAEAPQVERREL